MRYENWYDGKGYGYDQILNMISDNMRFIREKWTRRAQPLTRESIKNSIVDIRELRA